MKEEKKEVRIVVELEDTKDESEIQKEPSKFSWKPFLNYTVSLVNGVMFISISEVGGVKLTEVIHLSGVVAEALTHVLSGLGGLVYGAFYLKILEEMDIKKPENVSQILLTIMTFITSLSYLEGSLQGTQLLGISSELAIPLCIVFFFFRVLACADSAFKFKGQIKGMLDDFRNAWKEKNYKNLARLISAFLIGAGYSICAMDSVYASVERILKAWIGLSGDTQTLSFVAGAMGGIVMFPMALNWTDRGLKKLTGNGKEEDPTDRYVLLAVICVLPEVLGILGSTIGQKGNLFGFSLLNGATKVVDILKVFFSSAYIIVSDIPGMSMLLRAFFGQNVSLKMCRFSCSFFQKEDQNNTSLEEEREGVESNIRV